MKTAINQLRSELKVETAKGFINFCKVSALDKCLKIVEARLRYINAKKDASRPGKIDLEHYVYEYNEEVNLLFFYAYTEKFSESFPIGTYFEICVSGTNCQLVYSDANVIDHRHLSTGKISGLKVKVKNLLTYLLSNVNKTL